MEFGMLRSITSLKDTAKRHLPPSMLQWLKQAHHCAFYGGPEWEFYPDGWSVRDSTIKGWNIEAIAQTQKAKWAGFLQATKGTRPLTIAHEAPTPSKEDSHAHHLLMAYAYVLTLAALRKDRIRLLDWGGGIGHYSVLSRCILPELQIDYFCKDVPLLCKAGREVLPDAQFLERDEEVVSHRYDLVLASGSLQCTEDWKIVTRLLTASANPYLFLTRLPVVRRCSSFVVRQRAYAYGYDTEYLSWFFNREELIDHIVSLDCELVREFIFHNHPFVHHAPEQATVRGFLFRSRHL